MNFSDIPGRYKDAKRSDVAGLNGVTVEDSLFLHGSVGTGKTHALYALANDRAAQGLKFEVFSFESLMRNIRSTFHGKGLLIKRGTDDFYADENWIIKNLSKTSWLGIDDLGSSRQDAESSAYTLSVIYEVVNNRYNEKLPLVVTSNKSLDGLEREFDGRIASRIAGMCKVIPFEGQDRRIKRQ